MPITVRIPFAPFDHSALMYIASFYRQIERYAVEYRLFQCATYHRIIALADATIFSVKQRKAGIFSTLANLWHLE